MALYRLKFRDKGDATGTDTSLAGGQAVEATTGLVLPIDVQVGPFANEGIQGQSYACKVT